LGAWYGAPMEVIWVGGLAAICDRGCSAWCVQAIHDHVVCMVCVYVWGAYVCMICVCDVYMYGCVCAHVGICVDVNVCASICVCVRVCGKEGEEVHGRLVEKIRRESLHITLCHVALHNSSLPCPRRQGQSPPFAPWKGRRRGPPESGTCTLQTAGAAATLAGSGVRYTTAWIHGGDRQYDDPCCTYRLFLLHARLGRGVQGVCIALHLIVHLVQQVACFAGAHQPWGTGPREADRER